MAYNKKRATCIDLQDVNQFVKIVVPVNDSYIETNGFSQEYFHATNYITIF